MKSPKIVIIQLKELIYTAIFAILGVVLIILLIFMFLPKDDEVEPTFEYCPGIYTSSIQLDDQVVNVEVTVSDNDIQSVTLTNLTSQTELLYPLLQPTMANISSKLKDGQKIDDIKSDSDNRQTTSYLLEAVEKAIEKSKVMK